MIAAFMVPQEPEKKPKYVDLDVAIKVLRDLRKEFPIEDDENKAFNLGLVQGIIFASKEIKAIPAADVRPVVRGENVGKDYDAVDQFVCSECGIELQGWVRVEHDEDDWETTYHEYRFNFCPNCGADMRPTSMSGANEEES